MDKEMFRFATKGDEGKVLYFIKRLAEYEKMSDEVTACDIIIKSL